MANVSFECRYCNGTGRIISGIFSNPCPACGGAVNIEVEVPEDSRLVDCRYCNGTGRVFAGIFVNTCEVCQGFGKKVVYVPTSGLANCKYCNGTGAIISGMISSPCAVCRGTGFSTPKRLPSPVNSNQNARERRSKPLCFICYGEPDLSFARKLNTGLNNKGIATWMYVMDYTPGQRTWREIIDNRRISHKFLVICSIASLSRSGVLKEIEQQVDEDLEKIVPISIDSQWTSSSFVVERGGSNLKPFLLDRNYADFVTKPFDVALDKLIKGIL